MHSLRLICSGRPATGLQPAKGASPAAVWDADDLELHVWLAAGTMTCGVQDPFDIDTLATLRLEMRETPDTEDMLCAAKEISSFSACTLEAFREGTGQHGTFEFSSTDTNFAATLDQVWISIVGEDTDGKRITFTAGYMAIVRSGDSDSSAPVNDPVATYTRLAFKTIAVSGQSNVVADAPDDTLTLAAGSGITITTNATTDTITITAADNDSAAVWGNITGTLSNQTDLINLLNAKVSTTTVAVTSGKVLTVSNTLTLAGTDGSTLNIGTGGTLTASAFTESSEGGNGAADAGKLVKFRTNGVIGADAIEGDALYGYGAFIGGVSESADGQVILYNVASATGSLTITATTATAARTWDHPDASGTYASQEWANGGNITSLGTVTTGTWNASVIGSSYGGAGTVSGLLKANGSGTVSAAVAGTDYLTPSGDGSSLTALNATQLTSGTIPDARFPATLPAASGANLTALNATQLTSGTIPDARFPATLPAASGANLTSLTPANITGITLHGRRMIASTNIVDAIWTGSAGGTVSGTAATNRISDAQAMQIYYTGAITGVSRSVLHNNYSTGMPYTAFFPGSRVANVALPNNATINWDAAWFAIWSGTNYLGSNGAQHDMQFGVPYNHTAQSLSAKGLRVKITAVGTGASDATICLVAHNGSSETNGSTSAMSGADWTVATWWLDWQPGVGAYLYRNGTLVSSVTTGLPSGTGAGDDISVGLFVGAAGADSCGTMQTLRCIWL